MTRLPMSQAASALLRALLSRAGIDRDRILLSEVRSTDWQSLTFTGERHRLSLRLTGPGSEALFTKLTDGIEEAEFSLAGHIVADIRAERRNDGDGDGERPIDVAIEALTIAD